MSISQFARASVALLLLSVPVFGEQNYVTRYDAFIGYAYLNSPALKLPENGVQLQIGVRPTTWYSLGFDYSHARGDLTLTPDLLLNSLQQSLGAQLAALKAAGRIPAGYSLMVPGRSRTNTFAAGPQLAFRHFKSVTFLLRPSIGIIKESVMPKPGDAVAIAIVRQLAPTPPIGNTTMFWGVGGGVDFEISRHVAFRVQGDYVWDHLYNNLLQNGRRTVRLGIGPAFNFGKNIAKK